MTADAVPLPSLAWQPPGQSESALLQRGLGVGAIVFMVVAMAAPLAVVAANVPIVIATGGSVTAPVFFTIVTLILVVFSIGFTAMSRFVPNAGAFYSYIQSGLGRRVGTGSAVVALLSYALLFVGVNAYVGVAAAGALSSLAGWETPWWLWSLLSIVAIGVLGYRDIELSSKVLGFLLIAETLVVIVMNVGIVVRGGESGAALDAWSPTDALSGTPSLGVMFAFFSFIGFEATAVFRNEARDPDRTIPRATYTAVISIGVFYAISSWIVVMGAGTQNALGSATGDPENMVFEIATRYVGPIISNIMHVLLATSFFACVLSIHNVITRYTFTLGSKGILPRKLGRVHTRHRAPSFASLVVSIGTGAVTLAVLLGGLDAVTQIYTWFSGAATLGLIVLMGGTSIAVVAFFLRRRGTASIWRGTVAPVIATLLLGAVVFFTLQNLELLVGSTVAAVVVLAGLGAAFVTGFAIAIALRRRRPGVYAALDEALQPTASVA